MKNRMMINILIAFVFTTVANIPAQDHWFLTQSNKAVVESIVSTSELVEGQYEGKYLYPPINLLDGDFDTTWCEADEGGSGIGESITIELSEALSFNEIQLVNGFSSGNDYYHKNNRVARITLTQTAGEHFQQKQYTLEDDRESWQSIKFELIQTAKIIDFRIDDVYPGYKYDDTCFSDVRFLMDGEVIPFQNVEKIRIIQEELSRAMLNSEKGAFMKQIFGMATLYGREKHLLLLKSGTKEGILFTFPDRPEDVDPPVRFYFSDVTLNDINDSGFNYSLIDYGVSISDFSGKYEKYTPDRNAFLEQMGERRQFIYEIPEWFRSVEYFLSDYRLIINENIDYVETRTVQLLKLDGMNGLYINGEYYEILNEEDFLLVREEGP